MPASVEHLAIQLDYLSWLRKPVVWQYGPLGGIWAPLLVLMF